MDPLVGCHLPPPSPQPQPCLPVQPQPPQQEPCPPVQPQPCQPVQPQPCLPVTPQPCQPVQPQPCLPVTPQPCQPMPYVNPFVSLVPSAFPPGTDPTVVACFQAADQDKNGLIDDKELQSALSLYNQSFSIRTVHLLMYVFTHTNARKIGPKEFTLLFSNLQSWKAFFENSDRDRNGKIDAGELREALLSLGFAVSPAVLELLVSKFDKTAGQTKAIEYDSFIECCLIVQGLNEKFNAVAYCNTATFNRESFMLTVLPFLID